MKTALVASALWAAVVPYAGDALGLDLNTNDRVEIADHVIPGLLAVAAGAFLLLGRPGQGGPALAAGTVGLLAGIWMLLTHVELVLEAGDPGRPVGAVLFHALSPVPLVALAGAVCLRSLAAD